MTQPSTGEDQQCLGQKTTHTRAAASPPHSTDETEQKGLSFEASILESTALGNRAKCACSLLPWQECGEKAPQGLLD